MGRPKIKIIDDSQPSAEIKNPARGEARQSRQKSKIKTSDKKEQTKVESSSPDVIASPAESGTEQSSANVEDRHVVHDEAGTPRDDKTKKSQKPGKTKPRSKKYQELAKDLDHNKAYPLNEAVDLVKKVSFSKFEGSLEAHVNTSQTGIRGLVSLPFASGRKLRILAFGKNAQESGADIIGSEETIEEISKGKINFDIVVTTPDWMPKLAKIARILGPRGLMPNPKNGTITEDLKKAVEGFQAGKTEYKTESKAPVIHITLGKLNQPNEELTANIKTLLQTLGKSRVKKVTLSPTMGLGVKLDLSSL